MSAPLQIIQTNIPPGIIDLGAGEPQLDLLPLDMLRDAAAHRLAMGDRDFLQYGLEQGDSTFRATLAGFLSLRYGMQISYDDLFVTSGISSALDLLCGLLTQPGDTIFVEEPSYFIGLRIFADRGLKVVSIPTDEHGLDLDSLAQALKEHRPRFLYIIPVFQNPTGRTLSPQRRKSLVDMAHEYGFLILADEVYQLLNYTQAPPPSFGLYLDSGNVIALGSFSKILAPGLRLGWLHTHPDIIQRIVSSGLLESAGGLNPFSSAIVRSLIENGDLDKNIAHLTDIFATRMRVMDDLLRKHVPQVNFTTPQGGYFFWLQAPGVDAAELRKKAQEHKVDLRPGVLFSSRKGLTDYFRLSISYYGVDQIEEGILRLKGCFMG